MLLSELVQVSRSVAETSRRTAKIAHLSAALRKLHPEEVPGRVAFLSGDIRQTKIGIGYAALRDAQPDHAAAEPSPQLMDVDAALQRIANVASGTGSHRERLRLLRELLAQATAMTSSSLPI